MSRIHKEHLQAGYIFGDTINQEYIYLPSGEVGTDHPLAVLETPTKREDLTFCLLYTSIRGQVIERAYPFWSR